MVKLLVRQRCLKIGFGFTMPICNNKDQRAMMPIIGKTNMDEFAMGSSTNTVLKRTCNPPWDLNVFRGSGGPAMRALFFMVPLALWSDTGGSIRQPAAVTGTVELKPTYGRVFAMVWVAMASSLIRLTPMAVLFMIVLYWKPLLADMMNMIRLR